MTIGSKIKETRKNRKMTQKQLAKASNVAVGTIQQYELGKRAPRLEILMDIANALGVKISELLPSQPGEEYEIEYDPPPRLQRLFAMESAFEKLNPEGQKVAIERVEELADIPKYQKRNEDE